MKIGCYFRRELFFLVDEDNSPIFSMLLQHVDKASQLKIE